MNDLLWRKSDGTEHCPSPESLLLFHQGRLTGRERTELLMHLVECADCRGSLAELAILGDELDRVEEHISREEAVALYEKLRQRHPAEVRVNRDTRRDKEQSPKQSGTLLPLPFLKPSLALAAVMVLVAALSTYVFTHTAHMNQLTRQTAQLLQAELAGPNYSNLRLSFVDQVEDMDQRRTTQVSPNNRKPGLDQLSALEERGYRSARLEQMRREVNLYYNLAPSETRAMLLGNRSVDDLTADELVDYGATYAAEGKFLTAVEYFTKAHGKDPGNQAALYNLCLLYYNRSSELESASNIAAELLDDYSAKYFDIDKDSPWAQILKRQIGLDTP
ncbi:hypothetical protein JW905_08245 [bacterium]|nr:hypothetical protein [candidate division CSSED10-310 bacterium]